MSSSTSPCYVMAESVTRSPRIAVVIPVFNGASTVVRCVQSVLDQDEAEVEVVVVDDGSVDSPELALGTINDPRVRLIRQANRGVCAARNSGVEHVSAPFVCFLDDDDILLPGALTRYLSALDLERAPLASASLIIDRGTSVDNQSAKPFLPTRPHHDGPVLPGSFTMSKKVFQSLGGYVEELRFGENTELLMRAIIRMRAEGWTVPLINEPAVRICRTETGRAVRYGEGPAEAARYILGVYEEELKSDAKTRHDYHATIGTSYLRQGRRIAAIGEFARATRIRPGSLKSWARLIRSVSPVPLRRP